MTFKKAVKYSAKLRLALDGPSGSGKTMTGLILGTRLAKLVGSRLAVIDTERGSASLYSDTYDFDVLELTSYSPDTYVNAIHEAEKAGYKVLLIDSLSHAWAGKDGALEMKDRAEARMKTPNSYFAWREVTPAHNRMVETVLQSPCHIIVTLRSKVDYTIENRDGKVVPVKVGLQPIQREGLDYEFTIMGHMDRSHTLSFDQGKTRASFLTDKTIHQPTADLADELYQWLQGANPPEHTVNESQPEGSDNENVSNQPQPSKPQLSTCPIHNNIRMGKKPDGTYMHRLKDGTECFGVTPTSPPEAPVSPSPDAQATLPAGDAPQGKTEATEETDEWVYEEKANHGHYSLKPDAKDFTQPHNETHLRNMLRSQGKTWEDLLQFLGMGWSEWATACPDLPCETAWIRWEKASYAQR